MESKDRVTYKLLKKYYEENKNNIEMCGLRCKFDNENVCEPGKIKISNNSDIRRKRAGFDFAGNSKISEQIQNLLNNMNVKTKINSMDVENFKKTKEKYQNLKNELDENLEKFRQFIEICCENLEIDSKKNPKSLKFKNNKNFDGFNKELTALNPRYKIEEKYKNNMDKIELKIKGENRKNGENGIIKEFENSIKSLRGNLFNQGINLSKYYMRFAEKLNNLILEIDKKLKNIDPKVSDISTEIKNLISKQKIKIENKICFNNFDSKSKILGLKKTFEFIKQGLKLEREYLLTKDKRGKENNDLAKKIIDKNSEYSSLKKFLDISEYYAESELIDGGEYEKIDGNKEEVMDQIFGKNMSDNEWKPNIDDIQQGHIGDCYLLAALQSLCESNKERYIKDCFVNFEDIYDDHDIKLKFYKLKINLEVKNEILKCTAEQNGEVIINVENTVLKKKEKDKEKNVGNMSNKLWVNFFEKAFASYITDESNFDIKFDINDCVKIRELLNDKDGIAGKKYKHEKGKYYSIRELLSDKIGIGVAGKEVSAKYALSNVEFGCAFIPLAAITGKKSCSYFGANKESIDKLSIGNNISFKELPEILEEKKCLFTGHEYSISNIDKDKNNNNAKDCLELKNPWNGEKCYDLTQLKKELHELKYNNDFKGMSIYSGDGYKRGTIKLRREQITQDIIDFIDFIE